MFYFVNFEGGELLVFIFKDKCEINIDMVSCVCEFVCLVFIGIDWVYKELGILKLKLGEEILEVLDDG